MVYAVYLNPTIDKTVYIDSLRVGGTNRVGKVLSQGGGKAVNLAVTLHQMDVPVTVCGFLYKGNSRLIRQSLIGISTSLWEFPGEARVNTKIFDQQSGIVTEINESGPALSADILKQFEAVFLPQIQKDDMVVLTGSLPPGCPADYYAHLIEKLPCRVAVDADGETLARAVEKTPFLIKPNRDELSMLTGLPLETEAELLDAGRDLLGRGVSVCAISLGSRGALILDASHAYRALPLKLEADSTVGAGDSMMAGLCAGLLEGKDLGEALRLGSAAAAASLLQPGTGVGNRECIARLLPEIQIQQIQ